MYTNEQLINLINKSNSNNIFEYMIKQLSMEILKDRGVDV